ncbi:DUF4919 domain-containing protein [Glaciecola sp. MF2-115]|uniref:DUF4919 domain-containing protein n=1 Tax=Glaciecola sp. MF2-115 TaxID=3384827 RepID=UPI0039A2E40A
MSDVLKHFNIAILFVGISILAGCGSMANRAGTSPSVSDTRQSSIEERNAELAKEQQRKAKQQILNYAKADADYQALVAQLEQGDATERDFDTIIRVYPLTTKYRPYANVEQAQKLIAFESMEQSNWEACLQATARILEENYTSLTGHYGAMVCYTELGQNTQADYHNAMLDGFMGAIWRSGDGQTPATAFYITSTNDLYAFVQLNGMMATGQSIVYFEQRPIEAIKVEDPQSKQESTWYFDVTAQFRRGIFDDIESRR